MWFFKKKKIYRVKYKDDFGYECSAVVKATDPAQACREVEKRHTYRWQVQQILSIEEIKQ